MGTANGVLRWNGKELTSAAVPSSLLHLNVLSILRDRDANIWIGTSRGLFRYNSNGVSLLSAHETMGPVTALFEDREGSIWFGSARGLERLRDSTFVTYPLPNSKSQSAGALHVDSDGRTWIAPIEGGLRWLKGGKSGTVTADEIANDVVYSITGTDEDDIWMGRQRGGLTHLQYSGNSLAAKTYTQADGLVQNSVYAVYESVDRTIWAGTLSGGVSKLKDGHFTNYTTSDGLASNTVSAIAEGTDGTMWFGTPTGLSELAGKRWRNHAVPDGLVSPDVSSLLQDSAGVLWIGTAGGLAFLRNGRVQTPQGAQDWLHEPVLGMAEDRNGWLWVATSTRVLRAKRSSLTDKSTLDNSDFRVYARDDGWAGTEGVKRFRSVAKDSSGNVWFSTNHGLAVVNPSRSAVTSVPALLRIEAVMVDGDEVSLEQPIRVPPGEHRIVFHYLGLRLANPERVRYRSWLDGIDHGWSKATSNRDATFANLGPGKYRFRVICSSDGIWNNEDVSIGFSVLPAFYQTIWFRVSCFAALIALLWGIYQLRVQQLQRQFAIRLTERTRIARELHDTLLQNVHGLLFQIQAARNLFFRQPEEAVQNLDSAITMAEDAIDAGRDTIQGLRSGPMAKGNIAELLRATSQELADTRTENSEPPAFELIEEGERQALSANTKNEICHITLEILRNAYRHARAHRVEAEIRYGEQMFRLRIRDDGRGIDPKVLKEGGRAGHWGLRGIHERAERIGAQLDIWSETGAGTEVQLAVPAAVAYETPLEGAASRLYRKVRSRVARS